VEQKRWNPRDSVLKVRTLELFTQHRALRADEYAALIGWTPSRHAWCYLRRHWKRGFLHRKRDWRGRLVYSIAPGGARYLLWWKREFPDAKVVP
jgi:hypothetical protein